MRNISSIRHQMERGFVILVSILLICYITVSAESSGKLVIHQVDIAKFPDICLWATAMDSVGTALTGLSSTGLALKEDNAEKQLTLVQPAEVGIQLAIIVDASGSIVQPGATGKPRIEEVKQAIDELVYNSNKWINRDARLDWFSIIVPEKSTVQILSEPTNDYNALHNTMYLYTPPTKAGNTPMSDLLVVALQHLSANLPNTHPQKAIMIFSDGVDVVSSTKLDDAINLAANSHIPIFSVFLGPKETEASRNLKRLAMLTGGQYYHYQSLEALTPLFQQITSLRYQYQVCYRSSIASRSAHRIALEWLSNDGSVVARAETDVAVPVSPPAVTIIEPVSGTIFNRVSNDPNAPPESVEPTQTTIRIQWNWPDGFVREVVKVEYLLNGSVLATLTNPPFDQAAWIFGNLPSGNYSLTARVTDELGLVGESNAVTVQMVLAIPTPPPAEKAEVAAIEQRATTSQAIAIIATAIAIGALTLAVFVLRRKPQLIQGAIQGLESGWKAATAPFQRRRGAGVHPKAFLEVLQGDPSYQGPIPLYGEHNILGRDPALANIVFSNPTVSRLHCAIHERQPGVFFLEDRGGSGGTWVENQQVTVSTGERRLNDGDIIELAGLVLRFRVAPPTDESEPSGPKDKTAPYSRQGPIRDRDL
jgi:Mg-chelatase subunit ChlD